MLGIYNAPKNENHKYTNEIMTTEQKADHKKSIEDKQEAARSIFSNQEREVFTFVKSRWDALGNAYDADKHDQLVLQEAAQKFDISADRAKDIYIKVDGAGLDL